jgi:hypothetical protein
MSGGREMLTPTSTPAIAGTGNKNSKANSIVLKSNFFISFPRHRRYGIFFMPLLDMPPSLLPQNLLDPADLFLNFAGDLFTGTFRFQLWIIGDFPGDLLGLSLQFVIRAFRPVLRTGFHGIPPFGFRPGGARLLVLNTR